MIRQKRSKVNAAYDKLLVMCGEIMKNYCSLLQCSFYLHYSENHLFPAKPLRDSQSHLLTDTPSWSETSAKAEKGKVGKEFIYAAMTRFVIN